MSSDRFDDQSDLPVWLRNVPLPPRPDAPASTSEIRSSQSAAELPPWLREDDSSTASDNQALPSWLSNEPSSGSSAKLQTPTPRPRSQGFTGWLSSIDAPETSASSPQSDVPLSEQPLPADDSEASAEEMPDWLRQLSSDIGTTDSQEVAPADAPGWLAESMDEPSSAAAAETPSWLNEPSSAAAAETPSWLNEPAGTPAEAPSWLNEPAGTPAEAPSWLNEPSSAAAAETPSWLNEPASAPAAETPSWLNEPSSTPAETPSWLNEPSSQDSEIASTANETVQESFSTSASAWAANEGLVAGEQQNLSEGLAFQPFTLEDDSGPSSSTSLEAAESRGTAGQQDYNEDLAFQPFTLEDDSDPSSSTGLDAPAWLSDVGDIGTDESGLDVPAWLRTDQPETAPPPAEDVPVWLRTDQPETAPPPALDVPAWLSAEQSETPAQTLPTWIQEDSLPQPGSSPESLPGWLDQEPAAATELPDWLSTAETPSASDVPSTMPAWLVDAPAAIEESRADDSSAPSWLVDAPGAIEQSRADESSAPAWLTDVSAPAQPSTADMSAAPVWLTGTPVPIEQTDAGESIPDWLRDTQLTATPEFRATEPSESFVEASEEQPAWLSENLNPADLHLNLTDSSIAAQEQTRDVPDWLHSSEETVPGAGPQPQTQADSLPPWLKDEHGELLPSAMAPGDTNLPAWLRGMQDQAGIPAPTPPQPAPAEEPGKAAEEQAMSFDWFDDAPAAQTAAAPAAQANADLLGGAELPAWLRSDPEKSRDKEKESAAPRSLDWLSKLGGSEDDELLTPASAPRLNPIPLPTRTAAQLEAIALMGRLVGQPYPSKQSSVEEEQSRLERFGIERILSIVLLIALIVAIAIPSLSLPFQTTGNSAVASPLLEQIKTLGENDIVLLGYEWDAQRVSEMRPLERAVIGQLIEQNVKLIMVSTDPQASLLQYDLREQMTLKNYQGSGVDYILLGYRPGNEMALRGMAQDFRSVLRSDFQGKDATKGKLGDKLKDSSTLSDLSMVIVLADEPADVQGWMEQIYPSLHKPMAFLIPAGLQPVAQPYFQQPNVYAVTGTRGALAYEQLRGGELGAETALAAGQVNLATLIFALVLLLSALAVYINQHMRRRNTA